jgi:hypothetical protein
VKVDSPVDVVCGRVLGAARELSGMRAVGTRASVSPRGVFSLEDSDWTVQMDTSPKHARM